MRRVLLAATAFMAIMTTTPAVAALVLNGDGSISTSGTSGGSQTVHLNGMTDGPTVLAGLTADLTLTFTSVTNGGLTYNFMYDLFNSSSAPVTGSRVSSFGFDTDPDISAGAVTGAFTTLHLGTADNFPIVPNPEVCVFAPNNPPHGVCTGSGGGVDIGQHGLGTLSLTFTSIPTDGVMGGTGITLSGFVDRYQSITGIRGVESAAGIQVPGPVPEPATWALMLVGFGGIGMAMRRRRKAGQLIQIA